MALNYPANQDTTIESWTITNDAEQLAAYGKIYGIGELVPVNYNEILTELIAGNIPYAPLREYVFIEKQWTRTQIISEQTNVKQSNSLANAMLELYDYWLLQILPNFDYPLGVVTAMSSEVIQDNDTPPTSNFHLVITLKIQWFKLPPKF
jgi:hypothetical protein